MDGRTSAADNNPGSFVGGTDFPPELPWDGGGGATGQAEVSSSLLSSVAMPPSEQVMAAWLYPIVSGQDPAADDLLRVPTAMESLGTSESSKGKLPTTDVIFKDPNSSEKKRAPGGSTSKKVSEKRRRCKIAERFRTLRQLVPGCDGKSKASTLDQTIQYIRSLQQQVQSMHTSWQQVQYPVVPPPATVAMPMPPAATFRPGVVPMVPFGDMLPYPPTAH